MYIFAYFPPSFMQNFFIFNTDTDDSGNGYGCGYVAMVMPMVMEMKMLMMLLLMLMSVAIRERRKHIIPCFNPVIIKMNSFQSFSFNVGIRIIVKRNTYTERKNF